MSWDINSAKQRWQEIGSLRLRSFASELQYNRPEVILKYQRWFSDPDVTRYLSQTPKDIGRWLDECAQTNWYWIIRGGQQCFPFSLATSKILGHIGWKNIDSKTKTMERAIVIGEKRYWGLGIATRCIDMMTREGYVPPGIDTILVTINPLNPRRRQYLDRESDEPPLLQPDGKLLYRLPLEHNLRPHTSGSTGLEDVAVGGSSPYEAVQSQISRR